MTTRVSSVHLVNSRYARRGGGLHTAVKQRANLLAARGVADEVWIDVLGFEPQLTFRVNREKRSGVLHPDVGVRNVLTSLAPPGKERRMPFILPEGLTEQPGPDERTLHYLRDARLELEVHTDRRGTLEWVRRYDEQGRPFRREDLNRAGRVDRIIDYSPDGLPVAQRYLGRDGRPYLEAWMEPGTDEWGRCIVYDDEVRQFADSGALYRYALERLVAGEESPVLCSELREYRPHIPHHNADDIVLAVAHPGARKVAVAHSSHLEEPYAAGSEVSPAWESLLASVSEWDALVTWTGAQRDELVGRTGRPDRIVAIPPVAPAPVAERAPVDPDRIILVARTHTKKRVDEALRVFHAISRQRPAARLEVFGFGYGDEEEERIEALIDELGIRDKIRFGYTRDAHEIYDGAVAMLFTSISEGFGLALLESMAHGVPVVAYDAHYGPAEVVVDGDNGYLVPWGAHDEAAAHVLRLMEDPSLRERMGVRAQQSLARFSEEEHLGRWRRVLSGPDGQR